MESQVTKPDSGSAPKADTGWTRATTIMTCLTAFFVLTTAAVGTYASVTSAKKSDVQAAASGLEGQVATLSDKADQLTSERDDLKVQLEAAQKRIQELQATGDTPSADSASPTVSPAGTLRRSGSITWDAGTRIDFDAMDAQWGQFNKDLPREDYEVPEYVKTSGSFIQLGVDSAYLELEPGIAASYSSCAAASGYIPGDGSRIIGVKNFKTGDQMCWRTNEGRVVALSLTSRDGDRFSTDVKVYEG